MTDSREGANWNWWCDYCQRGKTGSPPLPEDAEVTDLGGRLVCDECNAPTITAVAKYDGSNELFWIYYRDREPPATETIHGNQVRKQDEHIFRESVDVPTATDIIEKKSEEDTVTLVPPFGE